MIDRTKLSTVGMNVQVGSVLAQKKRVSIPAETLQGKVAMM
jgi:hypothetical protein